MALSEDAIAIVAAQLTTAWAGQFLDSSVTATDDLFEVYEEFRDRVKAIEEKITRERVQRTKGIVATSGG